MHMVFRKHNSLKSSGSMFFQVQKPWVHIFRVKVYKGPCFSGPRCFRVWVPSAGPGFGRSQPEGLKLYQKESSAQVFYCEYSESLKNSFLLFA